MLIIVDITHSISELNLWQVLNVKCKSDYSVQNDECLHRHYTNERSQKEYEDENRCDLRWEQKMQREGAAVTCDGRLFHRRAAAIANALSPTVDRQVRQTSRVTDKAERNRRLDSVSSRNVGDRPCTPKLRPYKWSTQRPSISEVGKAAGWCGRTWCAICHWFDPSWITLLLLDAAVWSTVQESSETALVDSWQDRLAICLLLCCGSLPLQML